jgi:hypothetical protein
LISADTAADPTTTDADGTLMPNITALLVAILEKNKRTNKQICKIDNSNS